MKIAESRLKEIIKEELNEQGYTSKIASFLKSLRRPGDAERRQRAQQRRQAAEPEEETEKIVSTLPSPLLLPADDEPVLPRLTVHDLPAADDEEEEEKPKYRKHVTSKLDPSTDEGIDRKDQVIIERWQVIAGIDKKVL